MFEVDVSNVTEEEKEEEKEDQLGLGVLMYIINQIVNFSFHWCCDGWRCKLLKLFVN